MDDSKMQHIDLSSDEPIYRIENLPPILSHIVKCDTRATRELINNSEIFFVDDSVKIERNLSDLTNFHISDSNHFTQQNEHE